jgi:hypothetical protein
VGHRFRVGTVLSAVKNKSGDQTQSSRSNRDVVPISPKRLTTGGFEWTH